MPLTSFPSSLGPNTVPVSVIIPACDRVKALLNTLDGIEQCIPQPAEVLVHVDGGAPEMLEALRSWPGKLIILFSDERLGAGGSRNVLIRAAAHEWIVSFDDDSYPLDADYFLRVYESAQRHPNAAIISGSTMEEDWLRPSPVESAVYAGPACVFNKSWFLRTQGFVPLPFAQAMEEVDLSLQLHALGGKILLDPSLRVHHAPVKFSGHVQTEAAIFCNTVLFPFLRFPVCLWWMIPLQIGSRMRYLWRRGCATAILPGLLRTPGYLWKYRRWRKPVSWRKVLSWMRLRQSGPRPYGG